jgi:phosphate:Na+ symporter
MDQTTLALAGFGLFFTGLHLLAASMQPLTRGKARLLLSKISSGSASCAVAGSVLGLITQSTTASTFVCIGLLNSGALSLASTLAMTGWSSVGTSLLVFLATADVRIVGLYVVGLVGVAYLFNLQRHVLGKQITTFLFALGVLLLGLGMIKEVSIGLREAEWIKEFVEFSSEAAIIGFLFGVIVTLITQSSASVAILAVTLNLAGVLPFYDALIVVFGSSIGSGLSVVLATSHLNSKQKKLGVYQCLVKIVGILVLFPLSWLSQDWIKILPPSLINSLSVGTWIAVIYLTLQIIGALTASLIQDKLIIFVSWLCPLTEEESLFEPCYIYSEAVEDADTALILAAKEQNRLLIGLPNYLDPIRSEIVLTKNKIPLDIRHAAACHLAEKIKSFMEETAMHNHSDIAIGRIFALQSRNEAIISLQDSLNSFVGTLQSTKNQKNSWTGSMAESLHLILTLLSDSLDEVSDERDVLFALTSDRSKLMEKIRDSLLSGESGDMAERQSLFVSTGIFERIIWLVRQIVLVKKG